MTGCNKEIVSNEIANLNYKNVESDEDVIYNLNQAINNVKGVSFKAVLTIKNKEYEVEGKAILRETIEKSIINISYKNNILGIDVGFFLVWYQYYFEYYYL